MNRSTRKSLLWFAVPFAAFAVLSVAFYLIFKPLTLVIGASPTPALPMLAVLLFQLTAASVPALLLAVPLAYASRRWHAGVKWPLIVLLGGGSLAIWYGVTFQNGLVLWEKPFIKSLNLQDPLGFVQSKLFIVLNILAIALLTALFLYAAFLLSTLFKAPRQTHRPLCGHLHSHTAVRRPDWPVCRHHPILPFSYVLVRRVYVWDVRSADAIQRVFYRGSPLYTAPVVCVRHGRHPLLLSSLARRDASCPPPRAAADGCNE